MRPDASGIRLVTNDAFAVVASQEPDNLDDAACDTELPVMLCLLVVVVDQFHGSVLGFEWESRPPGERLMWGDRLPGAS